MASGSNKSGGTSKKLAAKKPTTSVSKTRTKTKKLAAKKPTTSVSKTRTKTKKLAAKKPTTSVSKTRTKTKKLAAKKPTTSVSKTRTKTKKLAAKKATRTKTVKKTRIVCLSHKEDLDGISAAALIKQAHGGDTVLTDYPSQMNMLETIASDLTLKKLFICDLGLSKKNRDDFIRIMDGLMKRRVSVTYIDHHDLDSTIAKTLSNMGVNMIHNTAECASVLVYDTFKSKLQDHASFVASCAAITDYMDERPVASKLVQMYDRQFALISATVMTYNIVGRQKEDNYLLSLVDDLKDSKFPHEIPDTFSFARDQVERLSLMIAAVKQGMKKTTNLAHMEITDAGAGGAVNFVLGMSGKDVGVAYKAKKNDDNYAVSVRGSKSCKIHLGKIVNILAAELGGSGGGHDKACGAMIPLPKIKKFVSELNKRIAA